MFRESFLYPCLLLKKTCLWFAIDRQQLEPLPVQMPYQPDKPRLIGADHKQRDVLIGLDEYLDVVKSAGFNDVNSSGETIFPVDYIVSDPTIQGIIKDRELTPETVNEVSRSIISTKVSAIK